MKLFLALGLFSFFFCGCGSTYSLSWQMGDKTESYSSSSNPTSSPSSAEEKYVQWYDDTHSAPVEQVYYYVVSGKDAKGSFQYVVKSTSIVK